MDHNFKGVALVIGINSYEDSETLMQLDKAVADATAISKKLKELGFLIFDGYDIRSFEFDQIKNEFIIELGKAQIGIFYFAGHGLECKGENILLTKDTVASTGNLDTLKRYSIILQNLVKEMHDVCDSNIIIVDACRQTYKEKTRGSTTAKIAPMFAPRGTLIAFSTSPGETAGEGPVNNPNSNYTTALLKHLDEPNLEIERVFKKVRTTLHSITNGKQTSWEHTSLIGNLIFNSGHIKANNVCKSYSLSAIADKDWIDDNIKKVIDGFKSYNYYSQNIALSDLEILKKSIKLSMDQQFVIGRNIYQAAVGGNFNCIKFLSDEKSILEYSDANGMNHLLNGILFEIYFDSSGQFRGYALKNSELNWMLDLIKSGKFGKSIDFIRNQLEQYSDRLLYIPSNLISEIEIVVNGSNRENGPLDYYDISDIVINGISLLTDDSTDVQPKSIYHTINSVKELQQTISIVYAIPSNLLKITYIATPKDDAIILLNKKLRIYK